jgi:Fe-S-cluster-containing dehydrogenase component
MNTPSNDNPDDVSNHEAGFTRRDVTKMATVLGGLGVVAFAGRTISKIKGSAAENTPTGAASIRNIPALKSVPHRENEDILIRMQEELRRAMAKPVEQRHWKMVIDQRKCVGCHACTVACIAENKLPRGVVYRPVMTETVGTFPNLATRFTPRPCMQCQTPSCVPVCPVEATYKRPDGIVAMDYDKCIGCGYCITACPYNARTRDLGENYTDGTPGDGKTPYETQPNFEYGKSWDRTGHDSPVGNARKCQFCVHRLDQGLLPQCVTTCIGRANYFGDANDPDSLVSEMAAKSNAHVLLEEMGTHPNVIYLA